MDTSDISDKPLQLLREKKPKKTSTVKKRKKVKEAIANPRIKRRAKPLKPEETKAKKLSKQVAKHLNLDKKKEFVITQELVYVLEYVQNDLTYQQIADKYGTEYVDVYKAIDTFWKKLTNRREATALIQTQKTANGRFQGKQHTILKQIQEASEANKKFLELLSEEDASYLSDQEIVFCIEYLYSGDIGASVEKAGLGVNILKSYASKGHSNNNKVKDNALRIRGEYLLNKPNVASHLNYLREERYATDMVDKEFIQRELLEQLDHLKNTKNPSSHIKRLRLSATELLGKTVVGCFSDKLVVEKLDPGQALDSLEQLTQVQGRVLDEVVTHAPDEEDLKLLE